MQVLTGTANIKKGARQMADWGAKEIIITAGSKGSVIYNNEQFYLIPAFYPSKVKDATGCGDTYMAGYLSQRVKGIGIQESGEFAAAMASLPELNCVCACATNALLAGVNVRVR